MTSKWRNGVHPKSPIATIPEGQVSRCIVPATTTQSAPQHAESTVRSPQLQPRSTSFTSRFDEPSGPDRPQSAHGHSPAAFSERILYGSMKNIISEMPIFIPCFLTLLQIKRNRQYRGQDYRNYVFATFFMSPLLSVTCTTNFRIFFQSVPILVKNEKSQNPLGWLQCRCRELFRAGVFFSIGAEKLSKEQRDSTSRPEFSVSTSLCSFFLFVHAESGGPT